MTFDNQKFENGVKTTINSLDKLKSSLKLDGAAKGLSQVEKAANSMSFGGLSKSVEAIAGRFSTLGIIGVTALQNITNQVIATGERMLKALTIDPVSTGFSEYETKINAIQTIMSNTASKGTTMSQITATLDELNTYADKTIYNFAEMTRNIGTFTAAGIGLEDAASSIKGIANLAAASGSTSQQASTAMYQLSQALSAGTVKLMDWNSVLSAGMGGEKFQEALKATAREYGISVDSIIEKNGSFRESLQEGWITADVLNDTLKKFTVEGAKEYAESMMRAGKYTQEQTDALIAEAQAMEDAATKVKTWTQLWSTLQESAQSGWAQSWELVFGNFLEARDFFTEVSDVIGSVINQSAEARNNLLDGALASNWTKLIREINACGIETDMFEQKVKDLATESGYDVGSIIKEYDSLENAIRKGILPTDLLNKALDSFSGTIESVKIDKTTADFGKLTDTLRRGDVSESVRELQQALKDFGYDLSKYGVDGKFGAETQAAVRAFQKANGLIANGIADAKTIEALKRVGTTVSEVTVDVDRLNGKSRDLISAITEKGGRELILDSIMNAIKGIIKISGTVKEAFRGIFEPMTSERLFGILSSIHEFSKKLIVSEETADKFKRACKGLFALFDIGVSSVKEAASGVLNFLCPALGAAGGNVLDLAANAGDAIIAFRDWIKENDVLGKGIEYVSSGIQTAIRLLGEWFTEIKNTPEVQAAIKILGESVGNIMKYFEGGKQAILGFISRIKDLRKIEDGIITRLKGLNELDLNTILKDFSDNVLGYFFNLDRITDGAKKVFQSTQTAISGFVSLILEKLGIAKEKIGAFFDFLSDKFSGIGFAEVMLVGFSAAVIGLGVSIAKALKVIKGGFLGIGDVFDSVSGAFNAIKFNFQVKAFATMIATLVGALALMTTLDQEKLKSSAVVLGIFAGALVGVMTALSVLQHFKLLDDFQSNAMAIVALSASLAIMVAALKGMEYVDKSAIGQSLLTLAAMMAMLTLFASLLGKYAPKLTSGSVTLVAYAAAVLILAEAMTKLSNIPSEKVDSALTSMVVLMGAMSVLALAARKTGIGSAVTMIAMVFTLNALVSAFDRIKEVDVKSIMANLDAFELIFGAFIALMVVSKFAGKNASGAGIGILAMSVSLLVIADAFKKIAKLSGSDAGQAMVVVGALLIAFKAIIKATAHAGDNAAKAGVTILAMAVGITILCGAIRLLSGLGGWDLLKATGVITALGIVLGGIILCTHLAQKANSTIIVITGCLFALSLVVGFLSMVAKTNPEGFNGAVAAVRTIGLVLGGILVVTKIAGKANLALITATVCVSLLAIIIGLMSELEVQNALANAAALSLLLVSLSAAMAILQNVPAAGAAQAAIAILAGLATITGVVLALGVISDLCGDHDWLGKGADALGKLGTAIGSFLGNIVRSFSAGVTSGLPQIGENLKSFAKSLSEIPEGAGDGAMSLAAALASITGATFLEGLLTLGDNDSVEKFGKQLPKLGEALTSFSGSISTLDETTLNNIKIAGEAALGLADLSDSIPKTGGLISFLTGQGDLGSFADDLSAFGEAMLGYATSVTNLNTGAITASIPAAESLVALAKTVPDTIGLFQLLTGQGDMGTFAEDLKSFGTAMSEYGASVENLKTKAIDNSIDTAEKLVALAEIVPNFVGLKQLFTGEGSLFSFGADLEAFGKAMSDYATSVENLNAKAIEDSIPAAEKLMALAEIVPGIATLWDHLAGGKGDLGTFGADILSFGSYLESYSQHVAKINAGNLDAVTASLQKLVALAGSSSATDFGGFANFGTALTQLGKTGVDGLIKAFTDAVPRANVAAQTLIANIITAMLTKVRGQYMIFQSVGQTAITRFIVGIKSQGGNAVNAMSNVASRCASAARGYYDSFYNAGEHCVNGFADGISARTWYAEEKSREMAKAAKDAASAELDEHSPSKEFYKIGDFGVLGFANAFSDGISRATKAGTGLARASIDGLRKGMTKISEALGGDVEARPTISPVLDLSDVRSGITQLNALMTRRQALEVSASFARRNSESDDSASMERVPVSSNTYNYTQNNYSPKSLSSIEIYRQTKNLISIKERG